MSLDPRNSSAGRYTVLFFRSSSFNASKTNRVLPRAECPVTRMIGEFESVSRSICLMSVMILSRSGSLLKTAGYLILALFAHI